MNSANLPTLVALLIQVGLGAAVFQANPRRHANQCFLLLSLTIGVWLASLYFAFGATSSAVAVLSIREASAAGVATLAVFNLLRLSIRRQNFGWGKILARSWPWLATTVAVVLFCHSDSFLSGATLRPNSEGLTITLPHYGSLAFLYVLYFSVATIAVLTLYVRDVRATTGGEQAELAFILIGVAVAFGLVLVAFSLGFFIEPSRLTWIAPFRTVLFNLIIAYGIATRKILEVGVFLRRAMSYLVLAAYLLALYGLIWWMIVEVGAPILGGRRYGFAHVIAALIVAFAMAPARGVSQSLADRLFVGTHRLDFRSTMSKATAILRSVTTLPDLLERFAKTIGEAVNTERVFILLPSRVGFLQSYPAVPANARLSALEFSRDQAVITYLETHQEPIVLDELHRVRTSPELVRVTRQMESLQIAVAMGIFSREQLAGVMLLGPRVSGRIYGSDEQNALQVLCGQLAVAIVNAELFSEVQNARIYNEILLQNLTTGVIAASADGIITVFNHEAEQITALVSTELLEQPV